MNPTPDERIVRIVAQTFAEIERSRPPAEALVHRRKIVAALLSYLASQFAVDGFDCPENLPTTTDSGKQSFSELRNFLYNTDERHGSGFVTPALLGMLVEQFGVDRAGSGAYYTPPAIASCICRRSLEMLAGVAVTEIESLPSAKRHAVAKQIAGVKVIDPACGSGAFLVAMQYELAVWHFRLGMTIDSNSPCRLQVHGLDLDELAVSAARIRLACAAKVTGQIVNTGELRRAIKVGDGLAHASDARIEAEFDVVVTNPPYGVTADIATRNRFFDPDNGVQSRDLYGLFVAHSLQLVRPGGIAALLVSDTWRTIRRHLPLRKLLVNTVEVVSISDLPAWIFPATVNTGIVLLRNSRPGLNSVISAADLRALPKGDWKELVASLEQPAQFTYPQTQVADYSRVSFFISSPRLHRILTNSAFTTLGEIASVRQGLATGDNKRYLRKLPAARGGYLPVEPNSILSSEALASLTPNEKINGLPGAKFGNRVFVPYDKGGASSAEHGWLPNYYVPTEYFIDWSEEAVAAMKTTVSDRQGGKIAARFQNAEHYFKQGITFSYTGYYAPSFRLSSGGVFDVGGSSCFDLQLPLYPLLAILASKLMKYLAKNFINHTVNFQVDDFKALPLPRELNPSIAAKLEAVVLQIVQRQTIDPRHPYYRLEQPIIDGLVNQLYKLSKDDVAEVNSWYTERYRKLRQ